MFSTWMETSHREHTGNGLWEEFAVKFLVSPILALDMYKKHSLGSVPGVGLWKEFPIGIISALILRERSFTEHTGYRFVAGVSVGTNSA